VYKRQESTRTVINQISQLGCQLALDDFGTGFSSLSHLHHFPIDTVKIDKSLMPGNDHKKSTFEHKLIRGIVAMLQYLEIEIVVEGIETESHLSFCCSLNIDRFQGFFLAKPMEVKKIDNLQSLICSNRNIIPSKAVVKRPIKARKKNV